MMRGSFFKPSSRRTPGLGQPICNWVPTFVGMTVFVLALSACDKPGQNVYKSSELGISRAIEYGTVIDVQDVKIIADNDQSGAPNGIGTLAGAGVGLGGASYIGNGTGNVWADVGGAAVGAVAGHYIEQELRNSTGYQYMLTMRSGDTKTITLEKKDGDIVFKPGDKVMLQYCDLEYNRKCKAGELLQRLIKVDKFPPKPQHKTKRKHRSDDDDETY